ncbi:mitochondrial dicarboxylate transporter [Fusarium sp. NRRL 52700]|nr:mitochondrial dicarboxylate transporter [Fusarium sp. NRRL 52700]
MTDHPTSRENAPERNVKYPFWFGGSASALAACVTHPLDLANVVPSFASAVKVIVSDEGVSGLYSGLTASVVRQLTYSGIRFGIYEELKSKAGSAPTSHFLLATAWCSGFAGGIAGNFADVLNVRMQHDGSLPSHQRHNYRHVGDGMLRLAREEGISAYMRGWLPNCTRAATQTAGQLASYDIIKRFILNYRKTEETPTVQATSAFLAAVIAVTVTNPLDVLKTRVMSSTSTEATGMVATARKAFRVEGPAWIFRGWVPSFLRVGPHTMFLTKSSKAELFPNGGWDTHHHIFERKFSLYCISQGHEWHYTSINIFLQSNPPLDAPRRNSPVLQDLPTEARHYKFRAYHGLSYGDDCTSLKPFLEVDDEAWLWSLREWLSEQEWHMLMVDNPKRLFG